MENTRINLYIILPDVPDERDECVRRMITTLAGNRGIDKVHVVPEEGKTKAQLCFHYDPSMVSIDQVKLLAKKAGAAITEQFGHLLVETTGVRHPRHARIIEAKLKEVKGIITVAVSGTGFVQLEFRKTEIDQQSVIEHIKNTGLSIKDIENFHHHEAKEVEGVTLKQHDPHEGHEHSKEGDADEHDHEGIFGNKTELIFSIISGVLLALGFGLSFIELPALIPIGFYLAAYFFGGFYISKEAYEGVTTGKFQIDFLMLVAAIGAAVLGEWAEGALLLFLFSLGHALEHYAMEKARKSIAALADLAPKTALLKTGTTINEVKIEDLKTDDIIVVKPNSKIAADGFVIKGNSSVNQAPITGESIPVDKRPVKNTAIDVAEAEKLDAEYKVFAGSINGGEALEITVTKLAADSTISRLVKLVNEAQTQKSRTQNFTDRLEKYYVPGVLILVGLLLLAFLVVDEPFSESFYRAMAVLVAASPCALAISTPSAVLSGVARAARGGVLIKGGKPLEDLGILTAIAFDKTGTLTEGKPKLTGVYPLNGITEEDLLETVIAVEKLSDHPLAAAIVSGGVERLKKDVSPANNLQSITGRGVKADYKNMTVHIGNRELFQEKNDPLSEEMINKIGELESQGNTTMVVQQNDLFIGIITLMDVARNDAKETLIRLNKMGIRKMIMLTGDNQKVADAIAKEIGITDAMGNLLPEQKIAAIEQLKKAEGKVAMVGDGVNDAPAMAKSTVGIAMGAAGSDVALETADIALMADKLSNLPFAIGLSKKASRIIKQNVIISLGVVAVLIPLTISGYASIGPAVVFHEGSTLVVVGNALRLLAYRK